MLLRLFSICLVLSFLSKTSGAQIIFSGTLKDRTDSSFISGATITNLDTKKSTTSDAQGIFNISSDFKDRLVITAIGYSPDTLIVQPQLFLRSPVILLAKQFSSLKSITVYADQHSEDSLETRLWYDSIRRFNKKPLVNKKYVSDPTPGFSFSPISHFSSKATAQRKLVKWLDYTEKEDYVTSRFSPHLVGRYTGLTGDSLRTFLLRYRPSYDYCTKASDEDILFYVNDCLKEYLHNIPLPKKKKRRR